MDNSLKRDNFDLSVLKILTCILIEISKTKFAKFKNGINFCSDPSDSAPYHWETSLFAGSLAHSPTVPTMFSSSSW